MTRDAQPSLTARQKLSKQPKEDEEKFSKPKLTKSDRRLAAQFF